MGFKDFKNFYVFNSYLFICRPYQNLHILPRSLMFGLRLPDGQLQNIVWIAFLLSFSLHIIKYSKQEDILFSSLQPCSSQFEAYFHFQIIKTQVLAQPRVHFLLFDFKVNILITILNEYRWSQIRCISHTDIIKLTMLMTSSLIIVLLSAYASLSSLFMFCLHHKILEITHSSLVFAKLSERPE